MRLVAGVLHITGVASNCYAGDKMVCMQINTKQQKRPNLTVANVCLKGGGYGRTLCLDGNWFGKVSPAEKDCYYIALDANCKIYIGFQQHSASVITWS